jgi:hypothetical protein
MSNEIRKYRAPARTGPADYADLKVVAYAGPGEAEVVLNIDGYEARLSGTQCLDLISVLSRRLLRRSGFKATDSSQCLVVAQDGSMIVEKEAEPEEICKGQD